MLDQAKKDKIDFLVGCDIEERDNREQVLNAICKTKWLRKKNYRPEDITLDLMEKLYTKVRNKYPGQIGYIQQASIRSWRIMIKTNDTHQWINSFFALNFFELMAKTLIVIYAYFELGYSQHDEKGRDYVRD